MRRYYLPDDSRHFRSPRGFLATRLFSSIPVSEEGGGRALCNRSKHCSGYYKIPFPSTAHSFIKSNRHGSKICVPSFVLIPISPSTAPAPCKLDVTRNAFNVIEDGPELTPLPSLVNRLEVWLGLRSKSKSGQSIMSETLLRSTKAQLEYV